jgi:hypothetical protein
LESISRTFAHQFRIQTATTHEHCNELLLRDEFELAVISEKLADGRGLQLLGQIARNSPCTLRILAARRSRLQILNGKLGPLGLFRTLAYPIGPQELLSALTLAGARLQAGEAPAGRGMAEVRPTVERISLNFADAMFAPNVPMTIASMVRDRRSNLSSARQPPAPRPPASPAPQLTRAQPPALQSAPPQAAVTRSAAPPRLASQSESSQPTLVRHPVANRAANNRAVSRTSRQGRVHRAPMRTKVVLGATIAVVFLVTTLTLNLVDASVHVTRASAPRPQMEQPDISTPPPNSTPDGLTPRFGPAPRVAHRVEPKPDAMQSPVEPTDPQMTASTTPVADPSTFGSEAYEPIYSN